MSMKISHPPHPGSIIKNELWKLWLSQKEFAYILDKTPAEISYIISGRRSINIDLAVRIWVVLPISPSELLELQIAYDLYCLRQTKEYKWQIKDIKKRLETFTKKL